MEVYSLVSSAKRYSPDFTQLPPCHRTCLFISHLHSPGSIQPGCHFRGTELCSNTQAFTVLPGTHVLLGRESARVGNVPCLGAQRRSINEPSRGSNPRSLSCKSRTLSLSHNAETQNLYMYRSASEADPGGGVGGLTPPPKDYPADSEIWRKGVADRL